MDKLRKLLEAQERNNYVEKKPRDVYRGISKATGIPKEEVAMIGGVESHHGKYEDNMAGSSAQGIMQIMPRLAEALRPGSSENLSDRNVQQELASDILNTNEKSIKRLGQEADVVNRYLMYNLGTGNGRRFLKADDSQRVEDVLPPKVVKANPGLYQGKTVGEAKASLKQFLNKRGEEMDFYPDIEDLFKGKE